MRAFGIAAAVAVAAFHSAGVAAAAARQGLDVAVPVAPVVVPTRDGARLVYELHLTSFAAEPLRLERLDVIDAGGATLATYGGASLGAVVEQVGTGAAELVIAPGTRSIAYLNLPVAAAPRSVAHRITVAGATDEQSIDVAAVGVDPRSPVRIGQPLRGGPWVAVYAPGMARGHRRVVYATRGTARLPGRFAIDWFRADANGRMTAPRAERPQDWFGHGAEVLAVADATVAATRDDVAEPASTTANSKVAIGDATGNFVTLDLGGGRYAFYEHLQPGLRVRRGDRVRRGAVIGTLGFTGQTAGPHLHFHVADANDPLDAEGVAFVLDDMEVVGGFPSIDAAFAGRRWLPRASAIRGPSLPAPNAVVRFPDRPVEARSCSACRAGPGAPPSAP